MLERSRGRKLPFAASASLSQTRGGVSPSARSQSGQTKASSSARSGGESRSIASLISTTVLTEEIKRKAVGVSMGTTKWEVHPVPHLPVQTGASQATGLAGLAPDASPPPAFHTRTKKYLLVASVIAGFQATEYAGAGL